MLEAQFLSFRLVEILGIFTTIIGIWLIIRQLTESRLASQMEGAISLVERSDRLEGEIKDLLHMSGSEEWDGLDGEEAFSLIRENPIFSSAYLKMASFYGLVGGLVRARALDLGIASEQFGYFLPKRWRRFEKYTNELRKNLDESQINEDWEWLAIEFEKMEK
jgi:hypothetical protein